MEQVWYAFPKLQLGNAYLRDEHFISNGFGELHIISLRQSQIT